MALTLEMIASKDIRNVKLMEAKVGNLNKYEHLMKFSSAFGRLVQKVLQRNLFLIQIDVDSSFFLLECSV
jgi:hypothetical protein